MLLLLFFDKSISQLRIISVIIDNEALLEGIIENVKICKIVVTERNSTNFMIDDLTKIQTM